jgi:hypothetical protein
MQCADAGGCPDSGRSETQPLRSHPLHGEDRDSWDSCVCSCMRELEGALCAGRELRATGGEHRNTVGSEVAPYGIMGTLGTLVCNRLPARLGGCIRIPRVGASRASHNRQRNDVALTDKTAH